MRKLILLVFFSLSSLSACAANSRQAIPQLSGIRLMGGPFLVFDHTKDKREPNHLPDIATGAWRERDGTVNLTITHYENYRMRGPDIEHLVSDPKKIFSSVTAASDIVESHYNYHHWLAAPYTLDGRTIYALVHSEWYACLLNNDCAQRGNAQSTLSKGNQLDSWANTLTSFQSKDGGASWLPNGLNEAHVVANQAFYWTGSSALTSAVYRNALNLTGLMVPSRIIKEGHYYYSIAFLSHRDFSRLDPTTGQAPIDKYGYVLIRTADVSRPSGWEAWVSGALYSPIDDGSYRPFSPQRNGVSLNASPPQIIYDTRAKVYVAIFTLHGNLGAIYYMTTPSLANPSWSDAVEITGTGGFQIDPRSPRFGAGCNTGFKAANYVSLIDTHSAGLNFEFTDGDPWLFYVANPAGCGGSNLARDLYRVQLIFDYKYGGN